MFPGTILALEMTHSFFFLAKMALKSAGWQFHQKDGGAGGGTPLKRWLTCPTSGANGDFLIKRNGSPRSVCVLV